MPSFDGWSFEDWFPQGRIGFAICMDLAVCASCAGVRSLAALTGLVQMIRR